MFRIVKFLFQSSWKVILLASISSAVVAGLNLLVFKLLADIVRESDAQVWSILILISVLVTCAALLSIYVGRFVTNHFEMKVTNYRRELSERVINANYQKTEKKLDRLVSVLLFEVTTIGNFGQSISGAMVAVFQLLVVMIYLITLSWQVSLMIIIIFGVQSVVNLKMLPKMKMLEKEISHTRFKLHFSLDRLEKGLKDLSMNESHATAYVQNSVYLPSSELAKLGLKLQVLKSKIDSFVNIFVLVAVGCVMILALKYYQLEQATLIEYVALLLFLLPSANTLFGFMKSLKNLQNAQDQIEEFDVNLTSDKPDIKHYLNIDENLSSPLISMRDLKFKYSNKGGFELGPISFDIYRNEIVIINGENGSGKSTLFKLLTGLYRPAEGGTYFQGIELTPDNIQSYRNHFGAYFTDSPVFDDLTYLNAKKVKSQGESLIDMLELRGKVSFDQINHITESGLSHGQKGRLNLLRLLLQDNEILFLDEWAANQDVHFKQYFYEKIVTGLKEMGKTVILISHDDKYYHIADKIISLKQGRMKTA